MAYRWLDDLDAVARGAGLRVVEIAGWKNRGRPESVGSFDPRGVLVHHTGGTGDDLAYAKWMALEGRPDLPPPLCQLALNRWGVVFVSAAGRANHAGEARASGPMPATSDGNALYVGIEAMNTGSEGWTSAQYDAYVRLCAALCERYGWPASHVRAHKETSTTGKWDPGGIDMDDFRGDVRRMINAGGDWFAMATKKELREVVDNALAAERPKIVQQVKHELLHESDVFPNNDDRDVTVNDVLAKMWSRG